VISEPENQSNLKKNALWKHWLFSVGFRERGHSFSNSHPCRQAETLEARTNLLPGLGNRRLESFNRRRDIPQIHARLVKSFMTR